MIPAKSENASPSRARGANLSSVPAGSMALVIDDEKAVRTLVEAALSRQGVTVLTADTSRKGVEIAREHSRELSVVILDLEMPATDGEEVLHQLAELNPEIPIILSSGLGESEAAGKSFVLRQASFLQKPYTAERLVEAVSEVLRRSDGSGRAEN